MRRPLLLGVNELVDFGVLQIDEVYVFGKALELWLEVEELEEIFWYIIIVVLCDRFPRCVKYGQRVCLDVDAPFFISDFEVELRQLKAPSD